ncbi:MAG: DUF6495 family protein [Saprospiraceae bacterium]
MRFRRLTMEELQEMEKEFVQFLVSNTITGEDWVKIKTETPEKADELIDLFSDIVFDKITQDIQYLEFKTPDDIKAFHCLEDKIILNGLRIDGTPPHGLDASLPFPEIMKELEKAGINIQIYTAEKAYRPDRAAELFRMLEGGARISRDGYFFHLVEGYKSEAV